LRQNAILIVEFRQALEDAGRDLFAAAVEAAFAVAGRF